MGKLFEKFARTRNLEGDVMQTELKRCLSTFDLVLMGIGSMVGSGMYVLAGEIAHEITGPALFLAFLVAGVASGLSAWCYAEFGARVPKAGSAYVYTYLTIGELAAFVIGWNLILEHVIGSAAVARGLAGYINALSNGGITKITPHSLLKLHWNPYCVIVVVLIGIIVCIGIKESIIVNNILTAVNIAVALFVVFCGFYLADPDNWSDFLPNGVGSIFKGAAQAYFAYVGYDSITIASEEALDPGFSVPVALAVDVLLVSALYCAVSIALTLMVPCDQIKNDSAFAAAFDYNEWYWAKYLVCVGAIAAMTCSLLGFVMTMPRCIYAMANDGIIFRFLAIVSKRTQVPVVATVLGTIAICIFAFFLTLSELAEFMSIGTLLAYLLIAVAVIVLRYHPTDLITGEKSQKKEASPLVGNQEWSFRQTVALLLFLVFAAITNIFICVACVFENETQVIFIIILSIFAVLTIISLLYIDVISKENDFKTRYRVPLVPYIPGLSVFINMYLMTQLTPFTWLRFAIWMAIGFLIYFFYGLAQSNLEIKPEAKDLSSEKVKENATEKVKNEILDKISEEDEQREGGDEQEKREKEEKNENKEELVSNAATAEQTEDTDES